MDTADGTDAFVLGKRKPDRSRQRSRNQIREMSRQLVESGEIPKRPCLLCGSKKSLTIHHTEPMRPDRFVFLCKTCHARAHRPLYRTITVRRAFGQFSVRPEATRRREEEHRGKKLDAIRPVALLESSGTPLVPLSAKPPMTKEVDNDATSSAFRYAIG